MIYFDHAATTPMDPKVIRVMEESMHRDFANSGTSYRIGVEVKNMIEKAREDISRLLCLPPGYQIIFTSGGSESNNLFIKGLHRPNHKFAATGLEHPSVREVLRSLDEGETQGVPHRNGRIDLSCVQYLKKKQIRLLCLSHVNNEIGSVHSSREITSALKAHSPRTRLFLDGAQAVGKFRYTPEFWQGLAGYSVSAHKFNGPKGIGLLIYASNLVLQPQIHGGGQQSGVRSGTLPAPSILGMTEALGLAIQKTEPNRTHYEKLWTTLVSGLKVLAEKNPEWNIRFNSSIEEGEEHQTRAILNFSFPPVEGEVILHHLEEKEIYVGLGSACSAQSKEPSKILKGIGLTDEQARCSLRISFGPQNTIEEVNIFLKEFEEVYRVLYPTFKERMAI